MYLKEYRISSQNFSEFQEGGGCSSGDQISKEIPPIARTGVRERRDGIVKGTIGREQRRQSYALVDFIKRTIMSQPRAFS